MGSGDTNRETREFILRNRLGLHIRPAGLFAQTAARFAADVRVEVDGNVASGKSILSLLTLEASGGARMRVTASGPQAREAVEALQRLVLENFGLPDEPAPRKP